jgi:hypothetical protein
MLHLILLVFAFVFFVLAALNVPSWRLNLIGAGLACWVLDLVGPLAIGDRLNASVSAAR